MAFLIVAHPDDECVFFGPLLAHGIALAARVFDGGAERNAAFSEVLDEYGIVEVPSPNIVDSVGDAGSEQITEWLRNLHVGITDQVITHCRATGEYGHPHHKLVGSLVTAHFSARQIPVLCPTKLRCRALANSLLTMSEEQYVDLCALFAEKYTAHLSYLLPTFIPNDTLWLSHQLCDGALAAEDVIHVDGYRAGYDKLRTGQWSTCSILGEFTNEYVGKTLTHRKVVLDLSGLDVKEAAYPVKRYTNLGIDTHMLDEYVALVNKVCSDADPRIQPMTAASLLAGAQSLAVCEQIDVNIVLQWRYSGDRTPILYARLPWGVTLFPNEIEDPRRAGFMFDWLKQPSQSDYGFDTANTCPEAVIRVVGQGSEDYLRHVKRLPSVITRARVYAQRSHLTFTYFYGADIPEPSSQMWFENRQYFDATDTRRDADDIEHIRSSGYGCCIGARIGDGPWLGFMYLYVYPHQIYWINSILHRTQETKDLRLGNNLIFEGLRYAYELGLDFNLGIVNADITYKTLWHPEIVQARNLIDLHNQQG